MEVKNEMYIGLSLLSAVFSSLTAIFGKKGLTNINSHVATFIRTGIILVYVWGFALIMGDCAQIGSLSPASLLFLLLSGAAAGGSWLCYYKALSIGLVSQVTAVDKSSVLLTMIFGMTFLSERVTAFKLLGLAVIAVGTVLMLKDFSKKDPKNIKSLLFAGASAIFAALTSILAKVGLGGVNANLGTAIRTAVVFVFAGLMILVSKSGGGFRTASKRDIGYLCLSALTTTLAWLCYFNALRIGEASIVAPLDKLSVIITVVASVVFLKEKFSTKVLLGAVLTTAGTILTLF